jgi:predicted RNA binding protein YcfA (HicA-like mRNA interferase family)
MPKLRTLSGSDLLRIFAGFGFRQHSQKGSHIKLRRTLESGITQTLTIVLHAEVDRGTLHAIYRQALRFIPETELREHFYTE